MLLIEAVLTGVLIYFFVNRWKGEKLRYKFRHDIAFVLNSLFICVLRLVVLLGILGFDLGGYIVYFDILFFINLVTGLFYFEL